MKIEKRISREARTLYDDLSDGAGREQLAKQSYLLAASLEDMFGSQHRYFQGTAQIESLPTAIEAAKDARDNLLQLTASRTVFDKFNLAPQEAEDEFTRNTVASTLMVFWCAHGLTGMDQARAARTVFKDSVAIITDDTVQDWDSFKQVLAKESQRYIP